MESPGAPTASTRGAAADRKADPTSAERVWILLAVALPAIASLLTALRMVDLAYHLRAGEVMIEHGTILRSETFSFVGAGRPWINQQWLAEVVFGLVGRIGGFEGLVVLRAASIAALSWLSYASCRARGALPLPASLLSIAGVVIAFPALALRPQLLGALMFALSLWILVAGEHRRRLIWLLLPIGALWVNLHGSFVLLPLLVALQVVSLTLRKVPGGRFVALVGGAATAATLISPYGIGSWRYAIELSTNPIVRRWISEWQPMALDGIHGWLFFGSAVVIGAFLLRRGRPIPWAELVWLLVFLVIAWAARRGLVWWGLVVPPLVAGLLPLSVGSLHRARATLADLLIVGGLAVGAVAFSPWIAGVSLADAPPELTSALARATAPGARVLTAQRFASWFELALPDRSVFVDSRIEQFPAAVWNDYAAVARGSPAWLDVADRWRVDAIVTEPTWTVTRALRDDPGWRMVETTSDGTVFVRRD